MKTRNQMIKHGTPRLMSPMSPARPSALTKKPAALGIKQQPGGALHMPPLEACDGVDVWVTPSQARKILGIAASAIYRLVEPDRPFLVAKRPLPRKILISLRSVKAFSEATKNPEFWQSPPLQQQLGAKLKQIAENKA
jgi:hypothetical protein